MVGCYHKSISDVVSLILPSGLGVKKEKRGCESLDSMLKITLFKIKWSHGR
jgi:NAD(P)H-hydrate repair Nnr-like enzyme with NAD(P)H-hydrate epimerase domain